MQTSLIADHFPLTTKYYDASYGTSHALSTRLVTTSDRDPGLLRKSRHHANRLGLRYLMIISLVYI